MHIKTVIAAACLLVAAPALAAPGDVSAHQFYTTALALKKKGMMALVSGKFPAAKAQFNDAMTRVRDDNLAARARCTEVLSAGERIDHGRWPARQPWCDP